MSILETKEEYYQFIAAWKYAANHNNNKRHWITDDYKAKYGGRYKSASWLTPVHYVLRNAMLGRPLDYGFSPKGENDWSTFESAVSTLRFRISRAKKGGSLNGFLDPFNGIITEEHLMKLEGIVEEFKKAA